MAEQPGGRLPAGQRPPSVRGAQAAPDSGGPPPAEDELEVAPLAPAAAGEPVLPVEVAPLAAPARRTRADLTALLIFSGVIAVLLVVVGVLYVVKSSKQREIDRTKAERQRIQEENISRTLSVIGKAREVGGDFLLGRVEIKEQKVEPALAEKLCAPFRGDAQVYNVIYTMFYNYRQLRNQPAQVVLYPERKEIGAQPGTEISREGAKYWWAVAPDDTPLFVGQMGFSPDGTVRNYCGGELLVIMRRVVDPNEKDARAKEAPAAPDAAK